MDYDIHAALAAGVPPSDIVNELAAHPEATSYDVSGALKAGVKPDEIVKEIAGSVPQDIAGKVIGPHAAGAISNALHAIVPGPIQRGRAHLLEGRADTADIFGAPETASYLRSQVDKEQLNAPSSQEALGKAINEGKWGTALYNVPGAVGEAIPQIAGTVAGAAAGGIAGSAIGGPAGAVAGFAGGAGADALLGIVDQAGSIAKARAKADGRETPNDQDIAVAVGSSAVLGALGRVGLGEAAGGLIANGVKNLLGRGAVGAAGKVATGVGSAVAHGASDAVGAVGQQLAETAGTQQGATVDPGAVAAQAVTGMGTRTALGAARLGTDAVTGKLAEDRAAARQEALRQTYEQASPEEQREVLNRAGARQDVLTARNADTENPVTPTMNVAARSAADVARRQLDQSVDAIADSDGSQLTGAHVKEIKGLISDARNSQRSPQRVPEIIDAMPLDDQAKQALTDGISRLDMMSTAGIRERNTSTLGNVLGFVGVGAGAAGGKLVGHPIVGAQVGGNLGQRLGTAISRKFGWDDPALIKEGAKAAAMLDAAGVAIPDTKAGMMDAITRSQDAVKSQAAAMGLDPAKYGWSKAEATAAARDAANEPTPVDSPKAIQDNLQAIQDRTAAQGELARQASAQAATGGTGLQNIGQMGAAIGANMRDMLWSKLQAGDTTELGRPSRVLVAAKAAMDAGQITDRESFDKFTQDLYSKNPQTAPQTAPQAATQAPQAPAAVAVASNRSTASSGAPSASADLSQLLPSRQPPQGFKSAMGERLPDWVYSVAHDVHQDLNTSGTPKAINYAQEVAKAVTQMQQAGYWDHNFSKALLAHNGRVSEGVYTAVRNQMLMNHGIDRRAITSQSATPMAQAAE